MRDAVAYQKRVINALNPSVRGSPNIALGLRQVDSPSKTYRMKLLNLAKRNLKLLQAKQHYNNLSFFSTVFKRYKHIERERRSIEEQRHSEKLAKRIMKKTGKSAESLFTCSTQLLKQPSPKRKVRLVTEKDKETDSERDQSTAASSKSSSHETNKSKNTKTTKSTKNQQKEKVIRKINFQDAKNTKQKPTAIYHAKIDEKSKSNNALAASQTQNVKVIEMPSKASETEANQKTPKQSNSTYKIKGILKNAPKIPHSFGY